MEYITNLLYCSISFKVRTGCAASDGFPFSVSSDADDIGDQMSDSN